MSSAAVASVVTAAAAVTVAMTARRWSAGMMMRTLMGAKVCPTAVMLGLMPRCRECVVFAVHLRIVGTGPGLAGGLALHARCFL